MSGTWTQTEPHRVRRRAALTLVFAGVLATGAVTGSWGDESADGSDGAGRPLAGAAAAAQSFAAPSAGRGRASGGAQSAEELVSRSGDRWSAAYTAREYEGLRQTLAGRYVGVGVSVHRSGGPEGRETVSVAEVQPGSPADEAGIRPGDRLHAVDGRAVAGRPVTEVVAQLRGAPGSAAEGPGLHPSSAAEPGSTVRLELGRDGDRRHVTLRRARLDAQTVTVDRLSDSVTRITVTCFTEGAGREVQRAVEQAPPGTAFLLDLRGNSGGLVDEAVRSASAFLDGGLIATYDDRGAQRALYAARGGDSDSPLVVLVDGGTMSAAELLTGALQDRGRAVIVGSRTFGKGSVQIPREMPDGSVAELTVGHYATPSGHAVQGKGITPDLTVPPASAASQAREVLGGLEGAS
jgi:carboxyl-terminal processing protease